MLPAELYEDETPLPPRLRLRFKPVPSDQTGIEARSEAPVDSDGTVVMDLDVRIHTYTHIYTHIYIHP